MASSNDGNHLHDVLCTLKDLKTAIGDLQGRITDADVESYLKINKVSVEEMRFFKEIVNTKQDQLTIMVLEPWELDLIYEEECAYTEKCDEVDRLFDSYFTELKSLFHDVVDCLNDEKQRKAEILDGCNIKDAEQLFLKENQLSDDYDRELTDQMVGLIRDQFKQILNADMTLGSLSIKEGLSTPRPIIYENSLALILEQILALKVLVKKEIAKQTLPKSKQTL